MPLDKSAPRLHLIAHEYCEYRILLDGIFKSDFEHRPWLGIPGRIPELLGIHLTKTLVALHCDAFPSNLSKLLVEFLLVIYIEFGFAFLHLKKRGLGNVNIPT